MTNLTQVMHPIAGFYLGACAAKIKKNGNLDLLVVELAEGSLTAATFTQNAFCAAPVTLAKQNLAANTPRALVINSGNANAGTGEQGMHDAQQTCRWVAAELGCEQNQVLPFSTGVIGENLPMDKVQAGIPEALASLSVTGWDGATSAIMTTDLVPKAVSREISVDGRSRKTRVCC